MIFIAINNGTTSNDVKKFKEIFGKISSPEKVVAARLRWNNEKCIDTTDPAQYPLVLYCSDNMAFAIKNVSAGYGGTGPNGSIDILKAVGFIFDDNEILGHTLHFDRLYVKPKCLVCKKYFRYEKELGKSPDISPVCNQKGCYICDNKK